MKKVFSLLIVILPVLAVYISPISGVDLGTFCAIIFFLIYIIVVKKLYIKRDATFWFIIFYTLIETATVLLFTQIRYSTTNIVILRTIRFVVMVSLFVNFTNDDCIDIRFLIKTLRIVTLFVSIYAITQQVFFQITGYKLINIFGITKQGVTFERTLNMYETTYRPPSIFLEPSSVVYYVVPYLCFCLFEINYEKYFNRKTAVIDAVIITSGVLATTSGLGILMVAIAWLIWCYFRLISRNTKKMISIIPIILGAILILNYSGLVKFGISRVISTSSLSAVEARTTGYNAISKLSFIQKIFGNGFGNYNESLYYTSFADILFCTGIIGIVAVAVFYIKHFIRGNRFQRCLVILSIVLMVGGGIYSATYLCFYLPLIIYKFDKDIQLEKNNIPILNYGEL